MLKMILSLLQGEPSDFVSILAVIALTAYTFSVVGKSWEQNKKAAQYVLDLFKKAGRHIESTLAFLGGPTPRQQRIARRCDIIIYCLYSATFYFYAMLLISAMVLLQMGGWKLVEAVIFGMVFLIAAQYYRAYAHKAYSKLNE